MGNFFEDVFVNPVKKVVKEVVVRPAEKIVAEVKREASWAVEQEKDWLKSDPFKVAAGVAAVALAGPVVLSSAGGVLGGISKAIPTITEILGGVSKVITAKEQTKQAEAAARIAESQAGQPGSNIAGQLAELLNKLLGAPSPATPPLIEPGRVQEAPATNWPLLGLLGVGAYLLLKKMR
ncbi:hypothetical protein MUP46_04705 [Patescibacteria group bacterium]|nr:hypothetical protein [Patescibacteria group bacterium]